MKKWLLLSIMWTHIALGQNLGFNGQGFFENVDAQTYQWLKDWNQPFTIRVPGGAISKFHNPYNVRKGWGMTEENVKEWYKTVGFDEDGEGLDKWLGKVNAQPDHSYMDDLIEMQKQFPDMQVLYVLNVLNSTTEANMEAIRYLVSHGVHIVGVEAGNEVYGKYASFSEYIADFKPIFDALSKEFPDIRKGLVAGANIKRKAFVKWNEDLADYKGDYDAVILHYYYTVKELEDVYSMIPDKLSYDPNTYYSNLDQAFQRAFKEMMEKKLIETGLNYANKTFPGKKIWITEWNTKPSEKLNNTIANGAWQFNQMVALRNRVEYFLVHNGVSPDKYGLISRANSKYDTDKTKNIRRIGYYAFQLASEVSDGIYVDPECKLTLEQGDAGESICYYFSNVGDAYNPSINTEGVQYKSAMLHCVQGKYAYSSAGYTGYMKAGSKASHEINGIIVGEYKGVIPKNSFGYIEFNF